MIALFNPNTDMLDGYFAKAKYLMTWRICMVACIVFGSLAILSSVLYSITTWIFTLVFFISICSLLFLKYTKKYDVLFWIFVITGTIIVHYSINQIMDYTHYVDFFWMATVIIMAFIGLGKRIGFIFISIHFIGIIYFFVFTLNTHIEVLRVRSMTQIVIDIIEFSLATFTTAYVLQQYINFNSYFGKELEKTNLELSVRNEENITLVKEIHHRVKNNLQIVISLLRLQKGDLKSEEAKRHFNEAINRILVMSLIHKKLYQEADLALIELRSYINDLSNDVINISSLGIPINFKVTSEVQKIGLKTIVPLGLLINELLSNSVKHAFMKKKEGHIRIDIKNGDNNFFKLIYADDGTWIERKKEHSSFGLGLIETLTDQLEGEYQRHQSEYTFTLKNLDD